MGYLMPKLSLKKNSSDTIQPKTKELGVHTFLKGISPKVNVIAQKEFKLTTMLLSSILSIGTSLHIFRVMVIKTIGSTNHKYLNICRVIIIMIIESSGHKLVGWLGFMAYQPLKVF